MKNQKLFAWACDFSSFRGEGILARNFACELSIYKKIDIHIKSPENSYLITNGKIKKYKKKYKKKINFGLLQNYYWPVHGIFYLWKFYFTKNKTLYLNFMPLWNFLLFYFLPPKVIIGPITGFMPKKKIENFSSLIRIILIPFFYKLSLLIIFKRFKSIIFSTNLLKKNFLVKDYSKLYFNYLISSNLSNEKIIYKNKYIDLLIYNRNYSVKEHHKLNNLINYLLKKGYKVCCMGDNLDLKGLKNYNIVSRARALKLLQKTKLVISSPENPYSLFTMDALKMGAKVLFDNQYNKKLSFIKYNPKHYINLDNQNYLQIESIIKDKKNYNKLNLRAINIVQKSVLKYFKKLVI